MLKKRTCLPPNAAALFAAIVLAPSFGLAQQATSSPPPVEEDEVVQLSPFEVLASEDNNGYTTTTTLAGNRLNTDLKDLGTSLSVYNSQFLKDIGATDNQSLLKYTLGTEIGGVQGNYSGSGGGTAPNRDASYLNPSSTNRVRGLVAADNTRDLYLSGIPWDGYNVDAVDLQRGPNAILFGQGSPSGVINTRTKQAAFRDTNEVGVRVDQYGSLRGTVDFNRILVKDQLAIRFDAVNNAAKFKQEPAFENFNREYFAVRYEPGFLKKGSARTIIKADAEIGLSNSNRPRNMPPGDRITPWFTALNQKLYNVAWMNDGNLDIAGRGDAVQTGFGNVSNPNYQPWINTNFGNNYYGGAEVFFMPGSTTPALSIVLNPNSYLGINSLGVRDGTIGGLLPSQPHGIRGYRDWAVATNQPFASLVKDKFITDTNIFDFYNKLIDGDTKREWSHFSTFDASISQTFFNDTMGFDVGYHEESYTAGNYSPLGGGNADIMIDYNSVWADGSNKPGVAWGTDGTKNPGVGRAFVQMGNGKSQNTTDRDSLRGTAFVSHDFAKGRNNWLLRLLGMHTVTGMASTDYSHSYTQNWVASRFTGAYFANPMFKAVKDANGPLWADFVPWRSVYISDSLVGKSLGQNLGLNPAGSDPAIGDTLSMRYFDSTWTATGVNPADPWYNQSTAAGASGPSLSTQSENPANYKGWTTANVPLLRDTTGTNRDMLTNGRTWDNRRNKAYAFVWQGKFWDNSIVGTAGVRHDEVSQDQSIWDIQNSPDRGSGDPALVTPVKSSLGPIKQNSRSWGVVGHLNHLPWLSKLTQRLPIDISATYNRSDNFQTGQVYTDYFGQQLPLPKGSTKDMGVVLATKDGRYSLRVNKFESTVSNNPSSFIQFWNYGNNVGIYAQAWSQFKYNYETRSNPGSTRYGSNIISDLPVPTSASPNAKWSVDYQPLNGQTQAQAEAQEIAVINAWDQWMKDMGALPVIMGKAWGFDWANDLTESGLGSFRLTSDLVSKGYEFELNAQITDNWRLTANASRIESTLSNIGQTPVPAGGPANIKTQIDYLLDFDRRLNETAMGDLRIWGGSSTASARENWNGFADGDLKARLAEQGTVVPENRLWHFNLITTYDFREGRLKGWSIGGAARYQSAATLSYTPVQHTNPSYISYDLSKPYRDDAETNFDLWVGYTRKVFHEKIDWRIQLNIANVGVGNELLPVTVQPDGTTAAYRIRPSQQMFITNTFKF